MQPSVCTMIGGMSKPSGGSSQASDHSNHLENILLLVIMGSLAVSAVMVGMCLLAITIHLCRRRLATKPPCDSRKFLLTVDIQWNLSNQDTNGAEESVVFSEVSSFQRLKCMQEWFIIILGVGKGVLFRELSSLQECPHRLIPRLSVISELIEGCPSLQRLLSLLSAVLKLRSLPLSMTTWTRNLSWKTIELTTNRTLFSLPTCNSHHYYYHGFSCGVV